MTIVYLGYSLTLELMLQSSSGTGSTGQAPTVAFRRVSDGYYLDFTGLTFKASGWTTRQQTLTEVSSTNAPGLYQYVLGSTVVGTEGDYVAEYSNTGAPAGVTLELWSFANTIPAGVQTGLTSQGFTTTRAGYLDTLNGLVTAVWAAGTRTLSAFSFSVTAGTVSDKTGYALTAGEHTAISGTDVPAGLTAQGYTATRAGYLDTLNGLVANIWAYATRTLTTAPPTLSAIVNGVWDELLSGHTTVGSAGKTLSAAGSAGDPWSTPLPGAYGAGSAGYIVGTDLDAAISSRLAAASYTAPPSAATIAATIWDTTMSGHIAAGSAGAYLALVNSYLDAAVSSRLATAGYTAPDNTDIAAIKAKTDNLPASPAAVGSAMILTSAYDAAKTAASQTSVTGILNLVGGYSLSSPTYDTNGNMLTCTILAGATSYSVTATYDGDGNLATYVITAV